MWSSCTIADADRCPAVQEPDPATSQGSCGLRQGEKGSQYCETLYYYLTCGRSLKGTCEALFTHRNTVLYRIHKMREDFAVPLDDPAAHTALLLSTALTLLDSKGAEFFVDGSEGSTSAKG